MMDLVIWSLAIAMIDRIKVSTYQFFKSKKFLEMSSLVIKFLNQKLFHKNELKYIKLSKIIKNIFKVK